MKAKIRKLEKNPRYRLLQIGNSHYLMDFGGRFWKIIFPFFTWIFPNYIYKVDDEETVKQLKAPPSKKEGFSAGAAYAGFGYIISQLFGSAVDFFDLSIPLWLNVALLVTALVSVVFLFQAFSQKYKKRLYHTVHLELLPCYKIRLHPKSFGHVCKLLISYVFMLVLSVLFYALYFSTQNIFILFTASVLFLIILVFSLYPGEEGTTTVKFLDNQKAVS